MTNIIEYKSIHDVPEVWDTLTGDNIYMTRAFLAHMEAGEDCRQRYYMVYADNELDSIFMTYYRRHYNLGMFTKFNLYQNMTFVYVPLSVTRPGIIYGKCLDDILAFVKRMKGPKIFLNLPDLEMPGFAKGLTCPKCILKNRFASFDDYMARLRSSYRRRYTIAFKKSASLRMVYLEDNREFTEEMYDLYLQVYNKSRVKIEKLPISFFRGPFFKNFVLYEGEKPVGFCQMLPNGTELIFEFVGVDYAVNSQYDTYHRMLLEIVRYGIENGFETIDFGQTADESKLKLGSEYIVLYAYLHDSCKLKNAINRKIGKYLSYRFVTTNFDVFKEG